MAEAGLTKLPQSDEEAASTRSSDARNVEISYGSGSDKPRNRREVLDEFMESVYSVPGKVGSYCSLTLLLCGMVGSIIAQKYAKSHTASLSNNGCPSGYDTECRGNGAVYRFSFALFIIFALQLLGTSVSIRFFDALWVPKIFSYVGLVIAFYFVANNVFDEHGYAWLARILGFFYLIFQQIILLDFAYCWNESWVAKAEKDGTQKWYIILLVTSFILIAGSISAIGIMYWQFGNCSSSLVIISLTIILPVIALCFQVFVSEHGSLLTSAVLISYCTYICYSAITLNPDETCNPSISTSYQTLSSAIGMGLTVLSLLWTTKTTIQRLPDALGTSTKNEDGSLNIPAIRHLLQQISIIFMLISCYYAMMLTNWATLQSSFSISSPKNGKIAMWLQACGEWIAILLYIWSLIAPKLFPDRDFSS